MVEDNEFQGQVALITGGGEGIGRAIAQAMASRKVRLAICGRRSEPLETAAKELSQAGIEVLDIPCDVTRKEEVERMVNRVIRKFGRLDILVNNAGMSGRTPIDDPDDSKWLNIIRVNLNGTYFCSKLVLPHMVERRYGRIVNISSVLGRFGVAGYVAYCTAKHGLLGFTKSLALEVASQGITVNSICPTWVDTVMARQCIAETAAFLGVNPETFREEAIKAIPIQRMAEADEIAGLTVFLCSRPASAITGQAINVCGGATAGVA